MTSASTAPCARAPGHAPRRNLHFEPWFFSRRANLAALGLLALWGLLLPPATPVGGSQTLLQSLSLTGFTLFTLIAGVVYLSNRRNSGTAPLLVACAMLLCWVGLFVRYSGADWSRLIHVFFNFKLLGIDGAKALGHGMWVTLQVGVLATVCAFSFSVALTLVRFFNNPVMSGFVRAYVDVFRALPTIVLVSLIHYGAPFIGIYLPLMVSGILTLTLNHSAFFSEILRAGVAAVGKGQLEAARSLGLSTFQTFRLIVLPQAVKTTLPPLTGQFVALLKETVICSVVGIPELLREALVVQSWTANPTPLILATAGYLVLLVPLTRLSRHLENTLRTTRKA